VSTLQTVEMSGLHGTNTLVEVVITKGTLGTMNISLIDEAGKNAYPLGNFKTDPKVEVQRFNVYIPNNQALGKYKVYAVLNGASSDYSDNYFTISK
jgi:hypothetical protein